MITKTDALLLLTELQQKGIDVTNDINKLYSSSSNIIPIDILKKINDNRMLELTGFYEKIRNSYNKKRSKIYINLMRSDENVLDDPKTVLTTLSALLNQLLQYECDNKPSFYKHARADEIISVLNIYFNTYNIEPSLKLLRIIKADIKVLEMLKK